MRAPMRRCRAGISDADQRDRPAVRAPPRGRSRLMNSSMRQPPGTNISAVLLSSCWARHVLALASISLPKGLGRRNEMLLVLSQHHTGSPPCDGGCDNPATELSANDTRYDMTHGATRYVLLGGAAAGRPYTSCELFSWDTAAILAISTASGCRPRVLAKAPLRYYHSAESEQYRNDSGWLWNNLQDCLKNSP